MVDEMVDAVNARLESLNLDFGVQILKRSNNIGKTNIKEMMIIERGILSRQDVGIVAFRWHPMDSKVWIPNNRVHFTMCDIV